MNPRAQHEPRRLARVRWRINGVTGQGEPVEPNYAAEAVAYGNRSHGPGTHWLEPVDLEQPVPLDGGAR